LRILNLSTTIDEAKDPEACANLVIHSKILANEGLLRVVLVSSEGIIMPILHRLSAMNRGLIYEMGDVKL